MYADTCKALAGAAQSKAALLKARPAAFFLSSVQAGVYVAFGGIVFLSAGGFLTAAGYPAAKFVAGLTFSAALSLVLMAGCDLFTGNNLTLGMGLLERTVTLRQALAAWGVCWLGNLAGSVGAALLFYAAGLAGAEATAAYTATVALGKVSAGAGALFARGVLCNICVCLAVWCGSRMKSESGKLIMVVWCILVFMLSGFEHSVANMCLLPLALLTGAPGVTLAGTAYNLLAVTLGNLAGGFAGVALPYWLISRPKR